MAFYLFVPGGMRTGQDWDQVRAILEGQGHQTRAITLSDPQTSSLDEHISQVLLMMEDIDQEGIILVGHSYASFVITGAAAQAPQRLARLVYVDSSIPQSGQSLLQVISRGGFEAAQFGVPSWPPFTQTLVFDQAVIDQLPKTYIHCLRSQFLGLGKAVVAYVLSRPQAEGWRYYELDTDHYCMLNQPQELARLLLD